MLSEVEAVHAGLSFFYELLPKTLDLALFESLASESIDCRLKDRISDGVSTAIVAEVEEELED